MTYVYRCQRCGDFEWEQRIIEEALIHCPKCKVASPVVRVPQLAPVHLNGRGFYVTDNVQAKKPL